MHARFWTKYDPVARRRRALAMLVTLTTFASLGARIA